MSTQPRQWTVDADHFVVDFSDEDELWAALMETRSILGRIGGSMIIAANREQIGPDLWETTGFVFKWSSFMPGQRQKPEPDPEPDNAADADA